MIPMAIKNTTKHAIGIENPLLCQACEFISVLIQSLLRFHLFAIASTLVSDADAQRR
jgi:hypothetical protein